MRPTPLTLLLLAACADDEGRTPGGTRAPPSTFVTQTIPCALSPATETFYDGPTTVHELSVLCDGGRLAIDVCTVGWTSNALLWVGATPPLEEHDVPSVEFDPFGRWDRLSLQIDAGTSYERNRSTTARCDPGAEAPDLTVLVRDLDGADADCVTTGAPPPDLDCAPL